MACEGSVVDDGELLVGLLEGNTDSWRLLIDRFGPLIRSRVADVARTFGCGHDDAGIDDVTAEVFASLLARESAALRAFAGKSHLSTYLAVIATRVSMRAWGKLTRHPTAVEVSDAAAGSTSTLGRLTESEDKERLLNLVARLPERQNELVNLFYVHGLSYDQISQRTGIPKGSIGPTLRRAESRLRSWMEESP